MGITEVAFLPLQDGKNLDDPTSAAGKTHGDCVDILLSQKGCQRVYWGLQVERPSLLLWFVDWDDIEDHVKFTKAEAFQSLINLFGSILGGAPSAYHVKYVPYPPTAALSVTKAPTIEIITMWFPTIYSTEDKDIVTERAAAFLSVFENGTQQYRGSATGWVHEDIDIPGSEEKGKAFVMLIGWTSVGAGKEFTNAQAFKDHNHLIMGVKDLKKIETVYTSLTEVVGERKPAVGL